jgi:hypothetical protein
MITGSADLAAADAAGRAASASWQRVRVARGAPTQAIDAAWQHHVNAARHASPADRLRIARRAAAVMDAFGSLPWMHAAALAVGYQPQAAAAMNGTQISARVRQDRREAMASHPVLAAFQQELDTIAAATAERVQHGIDRSIEESTRIRPAVVLAEIRATGAVLNLDTRGSITAPAGTVLADALLAELRVHKTAIVDILRGEAAAAAEAARPQVLA